jgi:hypothetical protein
VSFLLASGTALGVVCGIVALGGDVALLANWNRNRSQLAAALSEWYGVPIKSRELPAIRARAFEAWVEKRGLVAPSERDPPGDLEASPAG